MRLAGDEFVRLVIDDVRYLCDELVGHISSAMKFLCFPIEF